jgi:hypothetical protein
MEVQGGDVQQEAGRGCSKDEEEQARLRQGRQGAGQASEAASNWTGKWKKMLGQTQTLIRTPYPGNTRTLDGRV